ncbi:MAG TPA: CDP-diacylglycerol--glycerol-3-phosphate 3-phosphatidyltransferase [Alphaproteobacteria bacterium]|nr:CDP-diacylglycerol--glycerol-3-phosphate 3-phosphatidyltransferase [Alphaproteobacteria bacterium]
MVTSVPNILTFSRIGLIPLLVALFWLPGEGARWAALAIFILAGITDYLDGYLARAWREQSQLGALLDPIADKLLVSTTLFLLAAFDRIGGLTLLPAILILCREILVSGLREFLAGIEVRVPVSTLAKWKTTIQMIAIGFLIVGDAGDVIVPHTTEIGIVGLWAAAVLTLVTGYDYLRLGFRHLDAGAPPAPPKPKSSAKRPVNGAKAANS